MEEPTVILFSPPCVDSGVDISVIRGLLDVVAMNLQTYPGIQVRAPLFIVDGDGESAEKREILLWPHSYREEDIANLVSQCGNDIDGVLIPIATASKKRNKTFSFRIKLVNPVSNLELYDENWEGPLVEITRAISGAVSQIAKSVGVESPGHEKWPLTGNEESLMKFLQGVTSALMFHAGIAPGDFHPVIDSLLQSFKSDPDLDLAAYRLIGFLESLISNPELPVGTYKAAMKVLGQLEGMPNLPGPAHILIAEVYANLNQWTRAEANLKKGPEKSPKNGELIAALGNYYENQKQWNKARELYEHYLKVCSDEPSYLVLHNLGAIYAEESRMEKAIELWCKTLRRQPHYGNAYGNLMNAYLEMKEYGKMWVVFEEGLKHPPVPWYSYEHFIKNLDRPGDKEFTIEALQEYTREHPEDIGGHCHLGLAWSSLGERQRALDVLEQGLLVSKENREHNVGSGMEFTDVLTRQLLMLKIENFEEKFDRACQNVMKGKAKSSIPFFKECSSCVSSFWPAWFLLGKAHQRMEQYTQARKALEKAHQLAPEHSEIVNELGIVATLMNDHDYARKCFYKAVDLKPLQPDYLSNLALSLLKDGDYEKARDLTCRALAISPKDQVARNLMALLEESMSWEKSPLSSGVDHPKKKKRKKKKKNDNRGTGL